MEKLSAEEIKQAIFSTSGEHRHKTALLKVLTGVVEFEDYSISVQYSRIRPEFGKLPACIQDQYPDLRKKIERAADKFRLSKTRAAKTQTE